MAYNKAKAEYIWKMWKEAEEKEMRRLGVDERTIQELREYDWLIFNSDRRYYEKIVGADTYLNTIADEVHEKSETESVEDFLNSIESKRFYDVLHATDRVTLQILLLKLEGYKSAEIAERCELSTSAVNFRMWHLRKKIKKIMGI